MATHKCLVRMQRPDFSWWASGQMVDYAGAPDWKLQPLEPEAYKAWEAATARPDRVEEANRRDPDAGWFREEEDRLLYASLWSAPSDPSA